MGRAGRLKGSGVVARSVWERRGLVTRCRIRARVTRLETKALSSLLIKRGPRLLLDMIGRVQASEHLRGESLPRWIQNDI